MREETEFFAGITARDDAEKGARASNDFGKAGQTEEGSARLDAEVAGEDFAAGNEADLDAEIFARRREPGQVEEEGEVESPPGLQAGGIGEHPALARLPGALATLRVEEDQLEKGTRFGGPLPCLKRLVADFEVKEDFPRVAGILDDDRVRRMEHQRQRDVASRVFFRQVTFQHVDTPFKCMNPWTSWATFEKFVFRPSLSR
jgi:hypothetical protein